MNTAQFIAPGINVLVAKSLAYVLWQGTLIAAIALASGYALRKSSARIRYVTYCFALFAIAACLPINLGMLASGTNLLADAGSATQSPSAPTGGGTAADSLPGTSSALQFREESDAVVANSHALDEHAPIDVEPLAMTRARRPAGMAQSSGALFSNWIVALYLLGSGTMTLRLLIGLYHGQQLRRLAKPVEDLTVRSVLRRATRQFGLRAEPIVGYCARAMTPLVVGVVKPAILLPTTILSELTPAQVESLLLHEIAHIRRHDHLVHLLQRMVEVALFFHPAVWWLSRQISIEREHCCDDLAIQWGSEPCCYAEALVRVSELRNQRAPTNPAAATAVLTAVREQPTRLRQRVSRILEMPVIGPSVGMTRHGATWLAGLLIGATALLTTYGATGRTITFSSGPQTAVAAVGQTTPVADANSQTDPRRGQCKLEVRLEPPPPGEWEVSLIGRELKNGALLKNKPVVAGTVTFDSLEPGEYVALVRPAQPADRYYPPTQVTVTRGEKETRILLKPGPVQVAGRVQVTKPSGAEYTLSLARLNEPHLPLLAVTRLGDDGSFHLSGLLPGDYLVTVSRVRQFADYVDGGIGHLEKFSLASGKNSLDIQLPDGKIAGRIVGRLPERVPGERQPVFITRRSPPTNVPLNLNDAIVELEADGQFVLEHVPPGNYSISTLFPEPGFPGTEIEVEPGSLETQVVLRAEQQFGKLSGRITGVASIPAAVVDEDTPKLYVTAYRKQGKEIRLDRAVDWAEVDRTNLNFEFPALPEGAYGVLLRADLGHLGTPREAVVTWSPDVEVRVGQTRQLSIDVPEGRALEFKFPLSDRMPTRARWDLVLPGGSKLPMEAFAVSYQTLNGYRYPGRVLTRLPYGKYQIQADFGELGQQTTDFQIPAGDTRLALLLYPDRPAQLTAADDVLTRTRSFVRVVTSDEKMTFQGDEVTWDQLQDRLRQVSQREYTVLEHATTPAGGGRQGELLKLSIELGFEYFSSVGVHPLGAVGSQSEEVPVETAQEARLARLIKKFLQKSADSRVRLARAPDGLYSIDGHLVPETLCLRVLRAIPNRAQKVLEVVLEPAPAVEEQKLSGLAAVASAASSERTQRAIGKLLAEALGFQEVQFLLLTPGERAEFRNVRPGSTK